MRVHVIRNAPFEGPALIADWATARGHELTESHAPAEEYPQADTVDLLIVMGGPMDADDHVVSPWLVAEKVFVREVLHAGRRALGVCLGAQILAEVTGGRIKRNTEREIGWFEVRATDAGRRDARFARFDGLAVGHWHGDTFELPAGCEPLLSSAATTNQAFATADGRAVGLQFHIEWTEKSLLELLEHCGADTTQRGAHIMAADDILKQAPQYLNICRRALFSLLDEL